MSPKNVSLVTVAGVEAKGKETTLIADVHTDANPPLAVLEDWIRFRLGDNKQGGEALESLATF